VFVHGPAVKQQALALVTAGVNDCEISRLLGVARTTIRDWRKPRYVPKRQLALEACPRCWLPAKPIRFTARDYAELLGLYLGDGCISPTARTQKLRLSLDTKYPFIIESAESVIRRCFPSNRVGRLQADGGSTTVVYVYSSHLKCLFPQHGAGKKHERQIRLEPWQSDLVAEAPWSFLRGAIWSDGCSFINRTGPYEYLSYDFANLSADILDLVEWAYHLVGVDCRRTRTSVRVNRRASVALVEANVGLKR
jgi:Homeodomain-like domain